MKAKATPIYETTGNWTTEHKADGAMIISMAKGVSIYIQNGIASIYKYADLLNETEIGYMNPKLFNLYLHHINANN